VTNQHCGIFTTDASLAIRTWDAWMERVSGISAEMAHGKALVSLFPEIEARGLINRFKNVLSTGAIEALAPAFHHYLIACAPQSPSRRFKYMQQRVTIAPLKENTEITGTIVFIEDVTEDLANDDWRSRREMTDWFANTAAANALSDLIRAIREEHRNASVLNSALAIVAQVGWDTTPALIQLLRDADPEVRMYAALALGDRNDPRAVPDLIKAFKDESANVRYHAIEAIGKLAAPESIDALVEIANAGDFFVSFPALDALAAIGDSRVAPALVSLLGNPAIASAVLDALGKLGDAHSVEPIVRILGKPEPPIDAAVTALARIHERYDSQLHEGQYIVDLVRRSIGEAAVRRLLEGLDRISEPALPSLAKVLGWISGRQVEEALARLMSLPAVRKEAMIALTRSGSRVADLLIQQLDDNDLENRQAAAAALGRIGDPRAVPALLKSLTEDENVAVAAANALAKIGDRSAHETLVSMLGHPKAVTRRAVIAAINSLGHPDMAQIAFDLLSDPDPLVRESAVRIAGYFGYPDCVEKFFQCASDADENVRKAAVEHLPFIDDPRVGTILRHTLRHGSAPVRGAAALALGQMDGDAAAQPLIEALKDEDPWVRYYAVRSIGRLRCESALPALEQVMQNDPAGHVRIATAEALGQFGGKKAIALLRSAMEAKNPDIVRVASLSLAMLADPEAMQPLFEILRTGERTAKLDATRALAAAGTKEAVEALEWAAATEQDIRVRQAAVEELAQMASAESIMALIRMTADRRLRPDCIAALSGLSRSKIEAVASGLKSSQVEVRQAVVEALGRMKHPLASELLARALDDENSSVRLSAVVALGTLGSRLFERKLIELAHKDADVSVRQTARQVIERGNVNA
jgi:HEAT repeat protein